MPRTAAAILVDFDGTACAADVSNELLLRFGVAGWERHDQAVESGEETIRAAIDAQAGMLLASKAEMLSAVASSFGVEPAFARFCHWADDQGHRVEVVSDGFGFYIRPMLDAAGLSGLPVRANRLVRGSSGWTLEHPFRHPRCIGCGTCKVQAVAEQRDGYGWVAFVGNGLSDRFAVHFADLVFARDQLAEICEREGIAFVAWRTFDDVSRGIELMESPTRRVPARVCPGWTV